MSKNKENFLSTAYVAFGGNIGNVQETYHLAKKMMKDVSGVESVVSAKLYQTTPVSPVEQPNYLNTVFEVKTSLSIFEFFKTLQVIEIKLGKIPKSKHNPRKVDLDLLLFDCERVDEKDLTVPHPRMWDRLFVLIPLLDLTEHIPLFGSVRERVQVLQWVKNHEEVSQWAEEKL
ncbi:MAG: 2-amino-4-hydroxy-6-hydroxymethyldihydropteridine diphosphokinase [Waddliaceae bacterium]